MCYVAIANRSAFAFEGLFESLAFWHVQEEGTQEVSLKKEWGACLYKEGYGYAAVKWKTSSFQQKVSPSGALDGLCYPNTLFPLYKQSSRFGLIYLIPK